MDTAQLIEDNLPLVTTITAQMCLRYPKFCDRDELVHAGALGLVEAAHRYDPTRGNEFKTYAGYRIRGAILDALRADDWTSRGVRANARTVVNAKDQFVAEHHRTPTPAEVAEATGMTAQELAEVERRVHESLVLHLDAFAPVDGEDESWSIGDMLVDDGAADPAAELERRELHGYLRDAVRLLPERHRLVVIGSFFENRTSDELARLLGVTDSRVSQMRAEAFAMMRDGIDAQYNDDEPSPREPVGRVARRKATYAAAIASHRDWRDRITSTAPPTRRVLEPA